MVKRVRCVSLFNDGTRGVFPRSHRIVLCAGLLCLLCAPAQKTTSRDTAAPAAAASQAPRRRTPEESPHYDARRSREKVLPAVEDASAALREALAGAASRYTAHDTVTVKLFITPGGTLDLAGFVPHIDLDSTTRREIAVSVNRQVMLPIDKRTFTRILIPTSLDADGAVMFCGNAAIDYVEIRSLNDILIIINMNNGDIGRAYSRRWAEKPDIEGIVTVKFGIDEKGDVVSAAAVSSTVRDQPLEENVLKIVRSWKFGEIYHPGDVTEVVYPFRFTR